MSLFDTLIPPFARTTGRPAADAASELGSTLKPRYEVTETPEAYGLTVQLPGVAKEGLEITADGGEFRIVGRRTWKQPEGWTVLHRESADAAFELVLTHDDAIDADKIHAELKDGVLRASLPKAEALKPRKIAVS
jgi:HSP20 family molecular chaperone IbpA